ncbi:GGDEF domain-containing protein GdpS [Macrococcoides caseolyticum]|uniref:GGDEF domain-containing protein GdpS n=1 Tax=Macrococcoides caseolyticum TaxID=69966 RepID=UPI001F4602BE|nr:GGDEF domain-containing protein [Macrococcus caseolyticus]MCE4955855.1 GGDEF domain-containing protein [Macrococcus caseolyticus]
MIEAIIFNAAVTVSGIYLFHRLQFFEEKEIVFSKSYITLLMTLISFLLMTYPITYHNISFHLAFIPLLFLGRYTNFLYTMFSATLLVLAEIFIFNVVLSETFDLLIIGALSSMIGPFIKQNDFNAIQWLTGLSLAITGFYQYFTQSFEIFPFLLLVMSSFILSTTSSLMFIDIWRIYKVIQRYENEDTIDHLTGLGNVREFDRYLNVVSKQASEAKQSLSLLLIDIDDFKEVNDRFGHDAGDAVLKQMSQVIKNYVPVDSNTFRNAGEEFSVIFNNHSLDDTVKVAESIRTGVINASFHLPNTEVIHLTVTIGIGYISTDEVKTHRKIFKEADEMLHAAKHQGQNTVMFNPIIK